jgi:localization factor PodJL
MEPMAAAPPVAAAIAAPPPVAEPPPLADLPPVEAEDPLMDLESDTAAWDAKPTPPPQPVAEPTPAPIEEEPVSTDLFGLEPEPKKPAKDDYLAAARRAAQAGAAGPTRRVAKPELGPRNGDKSAPADPGAETEKPARFGLLRGLQIHPRTIGLAGAVAIAAAGGGYFYLNQQQPAQTAQAPGAGVAGQDALPITSTSSNEGATRAGPAPPLTPATLAAAAEKGDSVAQYLVAEDAIRGGDAAKGLNLLQRAANQGLAAAQYRLAKVYERGEGVAMDLNQARQWTERAAVAGNVKAMHDLGVYYARGEGAPFDETQAARWFRQAAEFGVADSQFNLAVLFQQGRGVQANASEAMFWYMVAAKGGDADAGARAESLGATMSASEVQSVRARAASFTPKPSNPRANGQFSAMAAGPAQAPG